MTGDRGLAAEVVAEASQAGVRIAVAESLTGGLVAAALVSVPGASAVFSGGIVAYDTDLKRTLLGVDPVLLRDHGPVDAEVAAQMAEGVRRACAVVGSDSSLLQADVGVATTGVAGPDPDPQTGQPPGTVWIGVSDQKGSESIGLQLSGGRSEIREAAVEAALATLLGRIAA